MSIQRWLLRGLRLIVVPRVAKHIKRFGLELGGKTPMLVFDDADVQGSGPFSVKLPSRREIGKQTGRHL